MIIIDQNCEARVYSTAGSIMGLRVKEMVLNAEDVRTLMHLDDRQLLEWFRTTCMTRFYPVGNDPAERTAIRHAERWHADTYNRAVEALERGE